MRGGTSKAIFLNKGDLPADPERRDKLILKIFGSPDVRQIDGLGGAEPLTSKLAIIGPPTVEGADINYTFGQVGIGKPYIDYSGNCGNISSAVGPYVIDEKMVLVTYPTTTVRIYNTNTDRILVAEIPVEDGMTKVCGDYAIDGVPGTAAKITLDFAATVGVINGNVLPTGNRKDILLIEGFGEIEVSIVDAGNPVVFVRARDIGMIGTEGPNEVDSNKELLDLLEKIRTHAAIAIGMDMTCAQISEKSPAFPMIAFVSEPADYMAYGTGKLISKAQVSFIARLMFMQILHKTYAGTGTTCSGIAAKISGTIVNEVLVDTGDVMSIGHPSGVIEIEAVVRENNGVISVKRAAFGRTARKIMDGFVYVGV